MNFITRQDNSTCNNSFWSLFEREFWEERNKKFEVNARRVNTVVKKR